jgi:hypothetical protein
MVNGCANCPPTPTSTPSPASPMVELLEFVLQKDAIIARQKKQIAQLKLELVRECTARALAELQELVDDLENNTYL